MMKSLASVLLVSLCLTVPASALCSELLAGDNTGAGTKTFVSEEYKFRIKYPDQFHLSQLPKLEGKEHIAYFFIADNAGSFHAGIYVLRKYEDRNSPETIRLNAQRRYDLSEEGTRKLKTYSIDGQPAVRIEYPYKSESGPPLPAVDVLTSNDSYLFDIYCLSDKEGQCDQVIETFSFNDKTIRQ